ncbi:sigma-70 family RNA polymerase sigma factor [Mycobacterium sp. 21AC1]|uniref:sigma-70 family RNA polymerase sigma factor n=1 Tax=[Mycobacterium] appelbergii TaxID=2939269 RepID=UPI002938D9FE|nr:sigma-70 family RNA polymerase sigma factor [Mycobacterium sp. 21AC1]MDV3129511.1 sigma-70 family RNA polymerase sigma factor [Mycobacterium sp. 21AC1]
MSAPSPQTTTPTRPSDDLERALDIFLTHRPQLFGIAYRVTGNVCEAEDLMQDAWLRWQRTDRTRVQNPAAFLTTTTTNLAINLIQSARHRHESPTASPLDDIVDSDGNPALRAEQAAAAEEVLALLMARLNAGELAAYVLRKGFDYPYVDLADLLRTSAANVRQLVRRAQTRLDTDQRRAPVAVEAHRLLNTAFSAARTGDLEDLERLLATDSAGRRASPQAA